MQPAQCVMELHERVQQVALKTSCLRCSKERKVKRLMRGGGLYADRAERGIYLASSNLSAKGHCGCMFSFQPLEVHSMNRLNKCIQVFGWNENLQPYRPLCSRTFSIIGGTIMVKGRSGIKCLDPRSILVSDMQL